MAGSGRAEALPSPSRQSASSELAGHCLGGARCQGPEARAPAPGEYGESGRRGHLAGGSGHLGQAGQGAAGCFLSTLGIKGLAGLAGELLTPHQPLLPRQGCGPHIAGLGPGSVCVQGPHIGL